MGPVKNLPSTQIRSLQITSKTTIKLLLLGVVIAAVPLGLSVRVNSKNSKAAVTVQAAGRGKPYVNLEDGRAMEVSYRGDQVSTSGLQSGAAQSRALATADLNGDGAPDLVAGYAFNGGGVVTIQKGNIEGFAPKDDSVFERMQQGYNPDSLLPMVDTYPVSEAVDFLSLGDFNEDGRRDVLVASKGGSLQLLAGDGEGQLQAAKQIDLPGRVLALTVGEFRAADGRNDVAVALSGVEGPEVLIFDGAAGGFESAPFRFALNGDAVSVEFGELDADPFMDLAIAGGSEVNIIHGWGRKTEARLGARVERISLAYTAQSFAVDNFTWDRQGTREIAVLSADGAVHVLEHSRSNKRAFSEEEILARSAARGRMTNLHADVEVVEGWAGGKGSWNEINKLELNAGMKTDGASQGLLTHGKISSGQTNALMVVNTAQQRLEVVHQVTSDELVKTPESKLRAGDLSTASLDANATPAALIALPKKLNGVRDLVLLSKGSSTPVLVPITPNLTFGVNTTSDHAPDGACNASPDCTFREAVIAANASAGPDTVSLPAGTYTLTIIGNTNSSGAGEGFSGNAAIGDVDFRDVNGDATTVSGAGAGTTFIVQSTANDRTLEPNPTAELNFDWTISGVTIAGGRDTGGSLSGGGGAMLSGSKDNITTITNCVIANNRASGTGTAGGGGILNEGGNVTITNTTLGGAVTVAACPSQAATNCGNSSSGVGGGITFSPGDPLNRQPSVGTLTVQTTSSFQNNTAAALTSGGGGAALRTHNQGTGSVSISGTTFTSNLATGSASGGGIIVESIGTTVATTAFNTNSAGNRGGGIQVAGGSLTLNGTSPSITFTGNTATTAGSSISTSSAVNLQGTNTTIGGDLEITTNGVWTNEVGSTMSPNNLIIIGTGSFTANNSTTNVSGNFQFQSGTFNAGTGLFNFNGTTAQTINNSVSITFNNLTDSNTTQPLTINNSIVVNGTLNVNGAGATLAPLAATVISGAGTLTGTGTARVTRTGANAFLTQYTITNKTLTNLTVEYNGGAAQGLSLTTYGPLRINNTSGVTLESGTATVNGLLTLTAGVLNVGAAPRVLVINNGTSVIGGSITSGADGTVNYNQGTDGQSVIGGTYGNLTFSNFNKVLAGTGTIGIAGVFTPGTAVGHTITGSTINFNGAGAQTIPVFNYYNLTSSGVSTPRTLANAGTIGIAGVFAPGTSVYTITGSTLDFNGSGAQTIPAFNYNNLTTSGARGANNITLINGGTIGIAGTFNPTATFAGGGYVVTNNTVVYNGTSAQILPATFTTYNNLTLNNTAGVTGFAGLIVQGLLRVQTGTFTSSSSTFNNVQIDGGATLAGTNGTTINVTGNWTNNGTFTANTNTVNFNGSGAQVIGGSSVTTFNNLTIANAGSGVSLGQNATVNAVLTLTNNLTTGANILTMPNTGTSAGTADVIGNVRRTGFTGGGPALSFGNPFNSIGFLVGGTLPTDITVNLVKAAPTVNPFPTAVQRTYTITPTGGAGFSATVRLHYLDTELNGNTEAELGLWRFNTAWVRLGRTGAVDTVNNWAELSGVTQFSPWTLASAKNDTTTTITSDNPDPSNVGQVVTVNYTVTSNVAGAPPLTGNVTITVNDASGDTCTGTVAAGTCALTLTTAGSKTLTATYSSDANFNGGTDTEPHGVTQTDINVRDGRAPEPASGSSNMLFTVVLSTPAPGPVSVNYQTADGGANPATAGTCGAGGDYVTTSGTASFTTGQQVQTVAVPICADGAVELDETFFLNLSSPVNGTIVDGQAVGVITANTPGTLLISEVRTSGPGGTGDDFVEVYNNTDSPLNVQAVDASGGVGVFKMGADCNATPVLLGFIPNGTIIPARGHYLFVGSSYSLGAYATADFFVPISDFENDRNVALFSTMDVTNLSSDTRLDAVGFGTNTGGVCDLLREGTNLQAAAGSTAQYSFARKLATGTPQDTNDNAADYVVVSIDPFVPVGSNPLPVLGAPGPENLASPIQRNATIKPSLIDPTQPSTSPPNRIRDNTPGSGPTLFGTLDIRRKFTNNTGQIVTQLRIRVVDITTTNTPGGPFADLRMLNSTDTTANGGTITILGTTLQAPSVEPPGGGFNTSLTVAVPGGTLANGNSVNLRLLLGVAQTGSFRFFINVEGLP